MIQNKRSFKKSITVFVSSILVASVHAANSDSIVFQTSFEGGSKIVATNDAQLEVFTGLDTTVSAPNNWDTDFGRNSMGLAKIQYEGGVPSERYAKIVRSSWDTSNSFLQMALASPNVRNNNGVPSKGRVQINFYGNSNLHHFSYSVRAYLHPYFEDLRKMPSQIGWLTVAEFWNNLAGYEYPFRITVNLVKPLSTPNSDYFFEVHAQTYVQVDAKTKEWKTFWSQQSTEPVPIGEWIKLEYGLKEGNRENGNFTMYMTTAGASRKRILSVNDMTHHPDDPSPNGFNHINPMKIYTSKEVINYLKNQNKALIVNWDDFEFVKHN